MVKGNSHPFFHVISPNFMTTTKALSLSGVTSLPLYLKYRTEVR